MDKLGRPKRTDEPKKTTLYLSKEHKKKFLKMSSQSRKSLGTLVEAWIDATPDTEVAVR